MIDNIILLDVYCELKSCLNDVFGIQGRIMVTTHVIELSFVLGLFVNAALFIPQSINIIANKDSKEVSFITFFGFWLIQLSTTLHGFIRKDYLLAFGTLISMITCGFVIWLIVYYRLKNKKG